MIQNPFDVAVKKLDDSVALLLLSLEKNLKDTICEVRLRVNMPLALTSFGSILFVTNFGTVTKILNDNCFIVRKSNINNSFVNICSQSIHSHKKDIIDGFITIKGGHRCGICGTAVLDDYSENITTLKDISSINLRIAKEVVGCSNHIFSRLDGDIKNCLICGLPSSGKTTILRDIARNISSGQNAQPKKVTIVDERSEISAVFKGESQCDVGYCCDILNSFPKATGIMQAIRVLSPDVIICDEIGGKNDFEAISSCSKAGVNIVASLHSDSLESLNKTSFGKAILSEKIFNNIVFLGHGQNTGKIKEIVKI